MKIIVALLSGRVDDRQALLQAGFAAVLEASPSTLTSALSLDPSVAKRNLEVAAGELAEGCKLLRFEQQT